MVMCMQCAPPIKERFLNCDFDELDHRQFGSPTLMQAKIVMKGRNDKNEFMQGRETFRETTEFVHTECEDAERQD